MELELTRINYGSVNTTLSNCLKLVPTGDSKKQQKVAVGDLEGNFQMFGIKKSEAHPIFQTFVGRKVASIQMGGVPGSVLDKVFVASDNVVKAFNKKGKMFLSFDTNLTEPIKCMFISGADLVICGNHVYSHYRDCKDIGTYLCGDTIVDVVALCPNNTNRILTILACSGRVLRILEHCRVRRTVELDSVPTVLHVPKNVLGDRILCGFTDGKVVLYQFGPFTGEIKQRTLVDVTSSQSAVTCLDTFDMSGDGRDELIIGRRDGTIQVFTMAADDDIDVECRQIYRESFSESISAIQGGCVYSQGWSEIVVLLYSGNIFGLTTQIISVSLSNKEIIKQPFALKNLERVTTASDLKSIGNDEDNIGTCLVKPMENYQLSAPIQNNASLGMFIMEVNDSLILDRVDHCYNLFIELPTQIAEIMIDSEAAIHILDAERNEKNYSIQDLSESKYHFTGKIRMKEERSRFEMKFQTMEGQYGAMQAVIVPRHQPSNAQMRTYDIRPLSLHFRSHTFDSTRPLNLLTLKGSFSHSEMHSWLDQCIPEVPERLSATEMSDLFFENSLIGTILECKYGRGNAQFRSDNLSTISILKDFLTKEATKKRIKLEMNTEISEPSVAHVLKLIEHSVMDCVKIKNEYKYLQALLQVDIRNESDFNCLMPEYQSILNRRAEIEEAFKKTPAILDKYFSIIADFYIDRFKFKGIFVKEKVPKLLETLENFKMESLLELFKAFENKETDMEVI